MRDTPRKWAVVLRLAVVAVCLWFAPSGRAKDPFDPYTSEFERMPPERGFTYREQQHQRMIEGRDLYRKRVKLPGADAAVVPWADSSRLGPRSNHTSSYSQASAEPPGGSLQDWLFAAMLVFVGIHAFRRLAPQIADSFNNNFGFSGIARGNLPDLSARVRAEEDAFSEFLKAFRVGTPSQIPAAALSAAAPGNLEEPEPNTIIEVCDPLYEFLSRAPIQLAKLRKLLQELCRNQSVALRQEALGGLCNGFRALKGMSGLPGLLSVWQMATALEGLLKQLNTQVSNVTPSTLRTVASAVDLLEELCQRGPQIEAGSPPPVRLLVVDDDLISRRAVAYALKRAFDQSDLAENGEEALAMAAQQTYDAVFLDVQMPGMDGYEVCSKIHATAANSTTPVVFVTCQSDFDARAQSILAGGNDLIAKPFLSFEITVKALTFVLRGRLHKQAGPGNYSPASRKAAATHSSSPPSQATTPPAAARQTSTRAESAPRPDENAAKKATERFNVQVKPSTEAGAWHSVNEPRSSWEFRKHRQFDSQW